MGTYPTAVDTHTRAQHEIRFIPLGTSTGARVEATLYASNRLPTLYAGHPPKNPSRQKIFANAKELRLGLAFGLGCIGGVWRVMERERKTTR